MFHSFKTLHTPLHSFALLWCSASLSTRHGSPALHCNVFEWPFDRSVLGPSLYLVHCIYGTDGTPREEVPHLRQIWTAHQLYGPDHLRLWFIRPRPACWMPQRGRPPPAPVGTCPKLPLPAPTCIRLQRRCPLPRASTSNAVAARFCLHHSEAVSVSTLASDCIHFQRRGLCAVPT